MKFQSIHLYTVQIGRVLISFLQMAKRKRNARVHRLHTYLYISLAVFVLIKLLYQLDWEV